MAKSANYTLSGVIVETVADLAPFPGRMATAWRVAAVCALVAGIAMMFEIPESAISCYLVIFLMKDDGALNTLIATGAVIAITILVALMIPVLQWTVESSMLRIFVMIVVSFIFIFIGAASKLGEGGSIVALIIAFILSLVNEVPVNGVISFALRYAWEMSILPMFVIAGFSLYLGRWSLALMQEELLDRLKIARNYLQEQTPKTISMLNKKLGAANDSEKQRWMLVKLLHQTSKAKAERIHVGIPASYQLLFSISALSKNTSEETRQKYVKHIDEVVAAIDSGAPIPAPKVEENNAHSAHETGIFQSLSNLAGTVKTKYKKASGEKFFADDAFTNPIYQHFALKTTLAAMLCYVFYASFNWQGIHTAMVTCYVASMGTAGDTIHKLSLRITGCLIGAAIGVASLVYIMPHLDTVGGLMVLVFFVALLAGWVTAGSEKVSYGGVQIGLAFTLTVLQGFGPTTDMDTARDRIIGILVGNIAVYLVSTLIWPAPVVTVICQRLSQAARKISTIAATPVEQRLDMISVVAETERLLDEVRYCFYLLPFEPSALRPSSKLRAIFQTTSEQLSLLNREIYFSTVPIPEAAERLEHLSLKIAALEEQSQFNQEATNHPIDASESLGTKQINMHLTHLESALAGGRA